MDPEVKLPRSDQQTAVKFQDNVDVTPTNKVEEYSKYLPGALKAIEERMSIAGALIIIVGYIVIASFGEMNSLWRFIGYFAALAISALFYGFYRIKLSLATYLLIAAIGFLLAYIFHIKGFDALIWACIKKD